MSALLDAAGDQIDIASITPASDGTLALWVYMTDATARQVLWTHNSAADIQIVFRGDLAGDPFEAYRAGATYAEATAPSANWSAFGTSKWVLIVWRYDTLSLPTLWIGDETTTPAGPSSYTTNTTLATPDNTAGAIIVASNTINTRYMRGRIGGYAWWNGTRLSDAQVGNWWADPFTGSFPAPSLFAKVDSLTSIADLTGNGNTGTGTGLSSLDSQPVILFPPPAVYTAWLRA